MRIIDLQGHIVPDDDARLYRFFGYSVTSPNDIRTALKKAAKEPVTVRINSYGGDVWSASDMYTLLRQHEPGVNVEITGLAASAATVVMMAGNAVRASPTAEIMIHNPMMSADGDYRAMEQAARSLQNTRETIVNAYELKTGLSRERLREMMDSETWMTAQSAKIDGFLDEILFAEDGKMSDEPAESAQGASAGAKNAALALPSADELRARWSVWNEIAPGAANIDDARRMLMEHNASAEEDRLENETDEPEMNEHSDVELLRRRIQTLAT